MLFFTWVLLKKFRFVSIGKRIINKRWLETIGKKFGELMNKTMMILSTLLMISSVASAATIKLDAEHDLKGSEAEALYNNLETAETYTNQSVVVRQTSGLGSENGYTQCVKFRDPRNGTFECKIRSSMLVEISSSGEIIKH